MQVGLWEGGGVAIRRGEGGGRAGHTSWASRGRRARPTHAPRAPHVQKWSFALISISPDCYRSLAERRKRERRWRIVATKEW
ncbi:hypothetical protein NL676_036411 [Syzygium grande]|nr:hypothetical protein NL676_036411 [Syzygium grande]